MGIEAKGPLTPDDVLEDQLVEDARRQDRKPIEPADASLALIDHRGWSDRQLGEALHVAPASVARAPALLESPGDLRGRVTAGELAPSVAYEVGELGDPEARREVAERVESEGMTRDGAAEAVCVAGGKAAKAKGRGASKPPEVTARVFRTAAAKVSIELRKGSGAEAIPAALRDTLKPIEAELSAGDQVAA